VAAAEALGTCQNFQRLGFLDWGALASGRLEKLNAMGKWLEEPGMYAAVIEMLPWSAATLRVVDLRSDHL
jgi:hypothetical protein